MYLWNKYEDFKNANVQFFNFLKTKALVIMCTKSAFYWKALLCTRRGTGAPI
jgi:hypothetical protein